MTSSKPRARSRQRLRQQVAEAVDPLPARYVLEAVAQRLELTNGWLEVRVRDGFVQRVKRTSVLTSDEVVFPAEWTEADKERYFEERAGLLRELNELTGFTPSNEHDHSVFTTDTFTAGQLLEREPKPVEKDAGAGR